MSRKKRSSLGSHSPNRTMLRRTLALMTLCGIVAFIVLGARLYKIQIIDHDYYEGLAIEQQVRDVTISADRGTIYDRNGEVLAMSATVENIFISPAEILKYDEDVELIASRLSQILGVSYDSIIEKAKNTKSYYSTITKKVEKDVADQVREFISEYNLKGVKIETDTKRYYPYSSLASHIVGFVGDDNYGLEGLEAAYDEVLTGTDGRVVRATTSNGTDMLFTNFEDYFDAEDGCDVTLTTDVTIQYFLEKHLDQAITDYGVRDGAAGIVMDVNTGEILAMASLGNYDLNNYLDVSEEVQALIDETGDESEKSSIKFAAQLLQWRNKAVSDSYEPGSTFKIITLAMAIEEGVVSEHSSFYCGGHVDVLGRTDPVNCWRSAGHGSQTLAQAVQNSCNVAFVNIGLMVGAEAFYDYIEAFGFFEKTGIDIGTEGSSLWWSDGVFKDKDNLSQLAAASFGQTFNITPIQLITAISACANGGYLMQPYLVSEVIDSQGNVVEKNSPTIRRQVISEETSALVCEILESVVTSGTGKNAYVAGYSIAGKTGTSTDTALQAETGEKEYIVSFVGFAPANDPQVAVLVLLDNPDPNGGTYVSGGQMAAPVVGNIFADVLPYLGVEAEYSEADDAKMDKIVPKIAGMTISEAQAELQSNGLTYRVIGSGDTVTDQLPQENSVVAAGSQILIYAGGEHPGDLEEMPDITGLTYKQAVYQLSFYAMYVSTENWSLADSPSAVITRQSVEPGSQVGYGTVVSVDLVNVSDLGRY